MIQSKSFNQPTWRDVYTYSKLPTSLSKLDEIAHNLWWVWNRQARDLFVSLNEDKWQSSCGNPVSVLSSLSQKRLQEVEDDQQFKDRVNKIYDEFKAYMTEKPNQKVPSVAYFSMEYGLTNVLKIYSGGLGVLAGDYLKEASDSNIDMTAVGFLYRFGYFDQVITSDGQQVAEYKAQEFKSLPIQQVLNEDNTPLIIEVPYPERIIYANVWKVKVGRIDLYLLDTDIAQNSDWDRSITHHLYGGDWENRMKQEYMLGIGGMIMLERLGIKKDVYHCNEGHAALINVQRLVNKIEQEGLSFDEALEAVRASSLYTVHTPVPAGHDYFDEQLFGKYMSDFPRRLGISWQEFIDMGRETPGSNEKFSMSVFALNTCQAANGVSKLHGAVSQRMFSPVWKGFFPEELHVGYVTNGVHMPTWMASEWTPFVEKYISKEIVLNQDSEEVWKKIQDAPNEEVWELRKKMKQRFVDFVRNTYNDNWMKNNGDPSSVVEMMESINPNALLIGFGRRFATYKRAHLLFTDLERLSKIVNNEEHPVQIIYTGKAHPADGGGQGLIKHIVEISKRPEFRGKILFLENYDIRVAQRLIAGVDIWLNTPTRPLEASGTSGEKALMNGVLNFSVLDGWWYEGYREGAGWAITDKRTFQNQSHQDQLDAATLYKVLEQEVIPLYYNHTEGKEYSEGWIQMIKNSMSYILPHYTMKRMLDDYIRKFYIPLHERSVKICANNNAKIKELIEWKRRVAQYWNELEVKECKITSDSNQQGFSFEVGKTVEIKLILDRHHLECDLNAELIVVAENEENKELEFMRSEMFNCAHTEGSKVIFEYKRKIDHPGYQKIAVRVTPKNDLLPHQMDFAYLKWIDIQ